MSKCIEYEGKIYNSIKELSDEKGINYKRLISRMLHGIELDKALNKGELWGTKIEYEGKNFKSLKDVSNFVEIPYNYFIVLLHNEGSVKKVVDKYYSNRKFILWGKNYNSQREIANAFGIDYSSMLNKKAKNKNKSLEDLVRGILYEEGLVFKGKKYNSLNMLCNEYGMSSENVSARLHIGWDLERALTEEVIPRRGKNVEYRGEEYLNYSELRREYKISYVFMKLIEETYNIDRMVGFDIINTYFESAGISRDEYLTCVGYCIYNGKIYKNAKEFCIECNVDIKKFRRREIKGNKENPFLVMKEMKEKKINHYKYNGKVYSYTELSMENLPTDIHGKVKTGDIQIIKVPLYPECTYNSTGFCKCNLEQDFKNYLLSRI